MNNVEAAFKELRGEVPIHDGPGYKTSLIIQDGKIIEKTDVHVPDHIKAHNRELRGKRSWRGEETLKVASVPANLLFSLAAKRGIKFEDLTVEEVLKFLREEGLQDFIQYGGRL